MADEDNVGGIDQFESPARRWLTVYLPLAVFVFVLLFLSLIHI